MIALAIPPLDDMLRTLWDTGAIGVLGFLALVHWFVYREDRPQREAEKKRAAFTRDALRAHQSIRPRVNLPDAGDNDSEWWR